MNINCVLRRVGIQSYHPLCVKAHMCYELSFPCHKETEAQEDLILLTRSPHKGSLSYLTTKTDLLVQNPPHTTKDIKADAKLLP